MISLWERLTAQLDGKRWGHTATAIHDTVYSFGGLHDEPSYTNVLHAFSKDGDGFLDDYRAVVPASNSPRGPSPRVGHSSVAIGHSLLIFGGWDGNRLLNDLFLYNTDTRYWSSPQHVGQTPTPRFGHSSVALGSKMYVFGGYTRNGCSNQLFLLDLDTVTITWRRVQTFGERPSGRGFHSCCFYGGSLVIFGGSDLGRQSVFADAYVLHTDILTWHRLEGVTMPVREGHISFCLGDAVYVFGGKDATNRSSSAIYKIDMNEGTSTQVASLGFTSTPRYLPAACQIGESCYVLGGYDDERGGTRDIYRLRIY